MSDHKLTNGRFSFDLNYRDFRGDEGLSIRVLGPVSEQAKELLRFDCFEKTPHYHVGVYDQNEITAISDENPVKYAFEQLASEFVELVEASGGDELTENEKSNHSTLIDSLRNEADQVIASAKNG